jgi:integrase
MSRPPRPRKVVVTRYYDARGKRCAKGDPGAKPKKERSATWFAKIGGKRVSLKTTDEAEAWAELKRRLRRRQTGEPEPQGALPLSELVSEWVAVLKARGGGAQHVQQLKANVTRLIEAAGWKFPMDMTADSCLIAMAKLVASRSLSAQSRNHYLQHAKQFARWLVDGGRLMRNPFGGLRPVSVEADRRHDRRVPTDEEIGNLMKYLHDPKAKIRKGMTGPQRALGYRVCMATGFRAGELKSLERASFDLPAGTVTCRAAYSKRRRRDTQHLPPWLVEELTGWFAAGGGCWSTFPRHNPGKVLQADLHAAGIPWSVPGPDGPLFFDFHALRHFFVSWCANQPGISPKTLMEMARHSDPKLTLRVYARARKDEVKKITDSMPPPGATKPGGK